ncbi:MAG: NYN domain-containing protein, partial [Firmicutes bacterium]|nr:NYN domain-containing protein [Bacillota bacterium]
MAKTESVQRNLRLAVLIDADNAPRDSIKGLIDELAIYGVPTIKRIYGDWTSPNLKGWKESLLENAFTPVQQYSYTTGKNSTDSAMIIDAMDILYAGRMDGFVLVSSDSDFTRLATRLREAGMYVIGIGERKTPGPFIASCDKFIYIEVIRERFIKPTHIPEPAAAAQKPGAEKKKPVSEKKPAAAAAKKPGENNGQKSR